ncbi:MAG: cbb3-type cytochrome c oxidase N-terminal domain-containing protein [Myxococcota bacterium]
MESRARGNLGADPETRNDLTDHNYDGISEYDNPLPGWWSAIFALSIVFAPLYLIYYHAEGGGKSMQEEYESETARIFTVRFKELGDLTPDRETLLKYKDDAEWLAVGRAVYKANCVSCHGPEGGGVVGPNLTDDAWIHVKNIEDIATVIENGAAKGSMPAWRNRLSHVNQIVLTAAYVASLRGAGAVGKAPEGQAIPAWDAQP